MALAFVLLALGAGYCHNRYSVVPDIYGTTYDNAISALREAGLDVRLVLVSTNENLANEDTRVYVSRRMQKVVSMRVHVMFIIDDNFAIEAIPLTAYTLEGKAESNIAYSWAWVADKSSENWSITVPIRKAFFRSATSFYSK